LRALLGELTKLILSPPHTSALQTARNSHDEEVLKVGMSDKNLASFDYTKKESQGRNNLNLNCELDPNFKLWASNSFKTNELGESNQGYSYDNREKSLNNAQSNMVNYIYKLNSDLQGMTSGMVSPEYQSINHYDSMHQVMSAQTNYDNAV
jgi:hypothetical protein